MAVVQTRGSGRRARTRGLLIAVAAAIAAMSSASSAAGGGQNPAGLEEPVPSPLEISVLTPPQPVLGADGRNHLVYELRLSNISRDTASVDALQPLVGGRRLGPRLAGQRLSSLFRLDSDQLGTTTLSAGMGATIFMDVTFPARQRPPRSVTHRIWLSYRDPRFGNGGRLSFTGAPTGVVQRRAVEIAPPLRGPRWVAGQGCCGPSNHQGGWNVINGHIYLAERFAIDFVQLDPQERLFTGPKTDLSSYAYFRAPIHAVANGTVVGLEDGLKDQTPGVDPTGITLQNAGGNYVVERIGPGRFAFYAHLERGSLRVRRGQRLRTGEVIGLLGNSGNSAGPHLHFHVMDSASPLKSNGIPYTFRAFRGMGLVTSVPPMLEGERTPIEPRALAGLHRNQMPLLNELDDFG
jgi:Peptidase family M23